MLLKPYIGGWIPLLLALALAVLGVLQFLGWLATLVTLSKLAEAYDGNYDYDNSTFPNATATPTPASSLSGRRMLFY